MRLKRVHAPIRKTAGRVFARRTRGWQLISASTVATFSVGFVIAAAAAGGFTAAAQPVGSTSRAPAALSTGVISPALKPYLNPNLLKAVPVGPGPVSEPVQKVLTSPQLMTALDNSGIPAVALEAYQRAATALAVSDPSCQLPWQLLAAIGRVESDNGQFGGAMLLPDGNTTVPIYGIPLDGQDGVALILNTNETEIALDGGSGFARAVGPMQFLPSTWAEYGVDANGDGQKDPNNIFDAALAAGDYLCAGRGNMAIPTQEAAAVLRYNDADEYVRVVLALAASYEQGDYAALPTAGPAGTANNGGGSTAGTPSSPQPEAPAPTTTPTQAPAETPAPQQTASSSGSVTPTESPSAGPTTTAPATPAPAPSAIPPFQAGQHVDIGWAPAMRQMVVMLLTAPKSATSDPARPTQNEPGRTQVSPQPAAETPAPNPS